MFKLVTNAEMMKVLHKWKRNKESVEFLSDRITAKKRVRKVNDKVLKVGGGTTLVKYIPKNIKELDADIQVLEENLTAKTWAKQRSMKVKQLQSMKINQMQKPVVAFDLSQSLIPQHPNSLVCEEDDSIYLLTCPSCLFSFWYEQETLKHMELDHGDDETAQDVMKAAAKKVEERKREEKKSEEKMRMRVAEGEKIICDVDIPVREFKEEVINNADEQF